MAVRAAYSSQVGPRVNLKFHLFSKKKVDASKDYSEVFSKSAHHTFKFEYGNPFIQVFTPLITNIIKQGHSAKKALT